MQTILTKVIGRHPYRKLAFAASVGALETHLSMMMPWLHPFFFIGACILNIVLWQAVNRRANILPAHTPRKDNQS